MKRSLEMDTLRSYFTKMKILNQGNKSWKFTRKGSLGKGGGSKSKKYCRSRSQNDAAFEEAMGADCDLHEKTNGVVAQSKVQTVGNQDSAASKSPPTKPPRRDQVFVVEFKKLKSQILGIVLNVASQTCPVENYTERLSGDTGVSDSNEDVTSRTIAPVKVIKIQEGSVADKDGRIRVTDEVIDINGIPLVGETCNSVRQRLAEAVKTGRVVMTIRRKRKRPAPQPPSSEDSPAQRHQYSSSSSNLTETSHSASKAKYQNDRTQSTSCLEKTNYYHNQSKESGLNIPSLTGSELSLTVSNDDVFTDSITEVDSECQKLPYLNGFHESVSPRTNRRLMNNHDQIENYNPDKQRTQSASAAEDVQWGAVPINSDYVNASHLVNNNYGVLTAISNGNNSEADLNVYQSDTELQMCSRLYKQRRANRNPELFRLANNSTPTSLCSFDEGSEYDFNCHSSSTSGKKRVITRMHLLKEENSLGLHIAGGKGSKRGDIGIFVAGISEGGPVHRLSAMALQKYFYIFQDPEVSSSFLVYVDDFFNFFMKRSQKENKNIRRSYVLRTFKTVKVIEGKEAVSVKDILRYCFNHFDEYSACRELVTEVEKAVLFGKATSGVEYVRSSLELYKLIAKTKYETFDVLFEQTILDASSVETLVEDHKSYFFDHEWRKILWFEYHFSKEHFSKENQSYEDVIKLKWNKYNNLLSFKKCKDLLEDVTKKHMRHRFLRHEAAKHIESAQIFGTTSHRYDVIDADLTTLIREYYPEEFCSVTVFEEDYGPHENEIIAVVEVSCDVREDICGYIKQSVSFDLQGKHELVLYKLVCLHTEVLQQYKNKDGAVARFRLRDDILCGKIPHYAFSAENADTSQANTRDTDQCGSCFNALPTEPLSTRNFSIIQEWHLDMPIELQMLFTIFINTEALRRAQDADNFLKSKLGKLYTIYDSLLNILNKNYVGIFQQANTDELLYDYRNIKSVFSITSATGATKSHSEAEDEWKKRADDDTLYFNTYLKSQPLTYYTDAGLETKHTSLRKCHIILMLDNLVRLKFCRDPHRSQTPTNQLCTLPITIQGLPLDAAITEIWHDKQLCDGSVNCQCKNRLQLTKADIRRVLLDPSESEKSTYQQFVNLCSWGYQEIWRKMPDDISQFLEDDAIDNLPRTDISETEEAAVSSTEDEIQELGDGMEEEPVEEFNQYTIPKLLDDTETRDLEDGSDDGIIEEILDESNEETVEIAESTMNMSMEDEITELEKSFMNLSIVQEEEVMGKDIVESFGFSKFVVPPLLCRHPPPATGRDDDISKIREILDNVLLKMGYMTNVNMAANRILCGPDHKIGNCLLKLITVNEKYASFLPEFPLLHLRKSMITILFSSYIDAGLIHILKFMRDDNRQEWSKLVSVQHIDAATRNVKRIGMSLHLAFLVSFAKHLPAPECETFLNDMSCLSANEVSVKWSEALEHFMNEGSLLNATFALHRDIMQHCDAVVAVSLAERLGGRQGYQLLLAAVKSTLPFFFVNGASSYGPYCLHLLHQHYGAGKFHINLKETLYTTPFGNSKKNFASDSKREMDHLEALKGFRSGSTISSVTSRMSLIDSLNEISRSKHESTTEMEDQLDNLGWSLTEVDLSHIFPTASLILRRHGLSLEENHVPFNVYATEPTALPQSILDRNSYSVGEFLIKKYLVREKLFLYQEKDLKTENIEGPADLVGRAKRSKGTTLKRTLKSKVLTLKSAREQKEEIRKKYVAKKSKEIDCLTSEVNACQALLKPDLSKPKVFKSLGMQRALLEQVSIVIKSLQHIDANFADVQVQKYIDLNSLVIPQAISFNVKLVTMEFAGVKFKTGHCTSGKEYLDFVETILHKTVKQFPSLSELIICEEKYSHTPDDFKCATREQRQSKSSASIDHLREARSVLNESTFNKDILTKTVEGKALISTYLAENVDRLSLQKEVRLILDSEYVTEKCQCDDPCSCTSVAIPLCKTFHETVPSETAIKMFDVKQRKGEAEMSQVDWLIQHSTILKPGEAVASIVTSGDIDSVYIHFFALSQHWPRTEDRKFQNPVYVILQKPGVKYDIYNVTLILECFETVFMDKEIGVKLAVALCIGGNDYIPKFQQISHKTVLQKMLTQKYRRSIFSLIAKDNIVLNEDCFTDFVKDLYCPAKLNSETVSYETVRALSIGKKEADSPTGYITKDPKRWLPPESAIRRLAELIQLQIDYLLIAGYHDKELPDFLKKRCLRKTDDHTEYDFGPDAHFVSIDSLPVINKTRRSSKRTQEDTPQRGTRRKRPLTSTPVK